ncbi:MAG: SDR family oxidoreductase [Myxococcaceae bacterium]
MKRLLVAGASGLVGTHLCEEATRRGLEVTGAARRVRALATHALDLTDRASIDRVLAEVNPDAVVLCTAWPWVDGCEKDPARSERENVGTVRNVIEATQGSKLPLAWFSTDHVFDGTKAAHGESDPVNPMSVYAKHKLAAERLLLERGHALIGRTSYVFGVEADRKNFLYRVLDASRDRTPLKVPVKQGGTPTWAGYLATSTLELLQRGTEGVLHLVGPEVLSKAEWAKKIARVLQLPNVEVVETSWAEAGQVAPRPEVVRLKTERGAPPHPSLDDVLSRLKPRLE